MNNAIMKDLDKDINTILNECKRYLDEMNIQEKVDELVTDAELLIRKHPIKSVLAGAAAGFLLAKLFRRD